MNAIILSIGDELVLGQTVDTNSAWLSQQLAAVGCDISGHATVPDSQSLIEKAITENAARCDFLIISGGIGPTDDDLTRQALAAVLNQPLELNEHWLKYLEDFFQKRGRPMPPANKIQAMIPRGAKIITNTAGTAAGIHVMVTKLQLLSKSGSSINVGELQGRPIGRILMKMGRVTREAVIRSLTVQTTSHDLLGQIMISLGYITESELAVALMAQRGDVSGQPLLQPKVSNEYMEQMFGEPVKFTEEERRDLSNHAIQIALSATAPPTQIFVIPGVPKEMKAMFTRDILHIIAKETAGAVILSRTLHTFGQGESSIAEKLGDLMNRTRNPSVGTTVANGIVSLRINARFPNRDQAQAELDQTTQACHAALGDVIFGQDEETLPQTIAKLLTHQSTAPAESPAAPPRERPAAEPLGSVLAEDEYPSRALTVTTAESCTGGLLAKMLTDIPGSSAYFKQGWITYSNKAKYERLGVSMEIINIHGAVSEPVVESMAKNARRLANSDFALSISGIAGPDGGSATKPVGTVCIALASADPSDKKQSITQSRTFNFPGDREMIRDRSAKMALTMLRFRLIEREMPF